MLYQTHHPSPLPLLFQLSISSLHHFITSSTSQLHLPFLPFSHSQAEAEMKCVEAALKSSFRKETAPKLSPQTFLEELSVFNAQNVATSCDDLFVDELLDFSHEEELLLKEEQQEQEQPQQQQNHVFTSVSPQQNQTQQIFNDNFASLPTSELTVPAEEAANLEWLSHFVEDSFLEHSNSFPIPIGTLTVTEKVTAKATETTVNLTEPCFKTPVPAKARSKRTRSGVRVWPPLKSPSFTDSSSSSSSSSSSETNLPEKKAKVRVVAEGEPRSGSPRRCSHCGVQKTPQWRAGPLGAKTLCNACGVRFKSGRLLPEYRPACSPTFSSELHSNHHRKVLEMRRVKEVTGAGPETGLTTLPVSGF